MRRVIVSIALVLVCLTPVGAQAGRGSGDSKGGGGSGDSKGGSSGSGSGLSLPGDVAIGLNLGQTLAFMIGSAFYEDETMVATFPVEVHANIRSIYGIAGTLQFTSYTEGGNLALAQILLAAGPRFRFTGKDIQGLYAVPKVGLGYMMGEHPEDAEFKRLSLVVQPEVGFGVRLGDPGLYLAFGLGVQLQMKLLQRPNQVTWSGLGKVLVHYTPVLNITVGFGG